MKSVDTILFVFCPVHQRFFRCEHHQVIEDMILRTMVFLPNILSNLALPFNAVTTKLLSSTDTHLPLNSSTHEYTFASSPSNLAGMMWNGNWANNGKSLTESCRKGWMMLEEDAVGRGCAGGLDGIYSGDRELSGWVVGTDSEMI